MELYPKQYNILDNKASSIQISVHLFCELNTSSNYTFSSDFQQLIIVEIRLFLMFLNFGQSISQHKIVVLVFVSPILIYWIAEWFMACASKMEKLHMFPVLWELLALNKKNTLEAPNLWRYEKKVKILLVLEFRNALFYWDKCSFLCHVQIGDLKGLFGLLMVNIHMLRTKWKVLDASYGTGTGNLCYIIVFKFKVPVHSAILFCAIQIVFHNVWPIWRLHYCCKLAICIGCFYYWYITKCIRTQCLIYHSVFKVALNFLFQMARECITKYIRTRFGEIFWWFLTGNIKSCIWLKVPKLTCAHTQISTS